MNADRGTEMPSSSDQRRRHPCRPRPAAMSRTAARCSTRSAATSLESRPSSRRSSWLVTWYGGLATTRNGCRGNRSESTSASTTRTGSRANRSLNRCARTGCSSTATTRAPAATRCVVNAPCPAPRSSTNSPGRTCALSTIRAAHASVSGCQPQVPAGRARHGADTPHRQEDAHRPNLDTWAGTDNGFTPSAAYRRRSGLSPRPALARHPLGGSGRRGWSPTWRPEPSGQGSAPFRR
jgi:hypothetical protein